MTTTPIESSDAEDTSHAIEIACDESGSDGENLIESRHRVFSHASTDLTMEEADDIVGKIRRLFRSQGAELKSKEMLTGNGIDRVAELFNETGPLHGRTHMHLLDKQYFAVGKIVDLLVEEEAYGRGIDLYSNGVARQIASDLFRHGRRALGGEHWDKLVSAFVSLIRRTQRKGTKATLEDFYAVVDDVRLRSHRTDVRRALALVWQSRRQAEQYSDPEALSQLRHLEPIMEALFPTASYWADRHDCPVRLVHDRQTIITEGATRLLVHIANNPHPDIPHAVALAGIDQVDSRLDARVQIADLTAGLGRIAGELALEGGLPANIQSTVRPLIDKKSVWDDDQSWIALTGRAVGT